MNRLICYRERGNKMLGKWTECNLCGNRFDADLTTQSCQHEYQEGCIHKRQTRTERNKKPAPMPEPVAYYGWSDSKYPEAIRMSFADGHTEIYDRRVNQPKPDTYVNIPKGRRGKK